MPDNTGYFMRLLIYILAMMSGFSAAEAARPVSATPATVGSSISHVSALVASVRAVKTAEARLHATNPPVLALFTKAQTAQTPVRTALSFGSPVTRHDMLRQ
jgi:hypothetical protein